MASQTIVAGQWGGTGGSTWDDGSYTGVRAIELSYWDVIGSFSVVYDLNGKPVEGPNHAGTHESFFDTVKIELQFPEEYIVSVNGFYSPLSRLSTSTPVIQSLTFKTNKSRTFGPYGTEEGTAFSLPLENGFIVGFKGRTGHLLDSIGFRLAL